MNTLDEDTWTEDYTADRIFISLMENGNDEVTKLNKYVSQMVDKFKVFTIRSPNVRFIIQLKDLDGEILTHLEYFVEGCNSPEDKYVRLDYIFTEVIQHITRQAAPRILSRMGSEDPTLAKLFINRIREFASGKWKLVLFYIT